MDKELLKTLGTSAIRHVLTAAGVWLAGRGAISCGATATDACSGVQSFVGAGMILAGVAWSWWEKVGQAQVAALLKKLTARSTIEAAKATAEQVRAGAAVK